MSDVNNNQFPDTYILPATGYDWRCQRCNYQWRSRKPDVAKPRMCANCGTAYWDRPRRGASVEDTVTDSLLLEPKRRKRPAGKKKKAKRTRRPSYVKEPLQTQEVRVVHEYIPVPEPPVEPPTSLPTGIDISDLVRITNARIMEEMSSVSSVLTPPPHLRRQYTRPVDEPMPETQIRKPNADERTNERNNNTD